MISGSNNSVAISFSNSGALAWAAAGTNPVRLSYHWRSGVCSGTSNAVWNGLRTLLTTDVVPGATVSGLPATVQAPLTSGTFCLQYDLYPRGHHVVLVAGRGDAAAHRERDARAVPGELGCASTPSTMAASSDNAVSLSFANAGTLTWAALPPNNVRLAYHWRNGACSGTSTAIWNGTHTDLPLDVAPGGSVTALAASVKAPATAGTYCLQYDLIREGVTWFSWQGAGVLQVTLVIT